MYFYDAQRFTRCLAVTGVDWQAQRTCSAVEVCWWRSAAPARWRCRAVDWRDCEDLWRRRCRGLGGRRAAQLVDWFGLWRLLERLAKYRHQWHVGGCRLYVILFYSWAREPGGQWGQMIPRRNLPGGQTWYFDPQVFWKEIFSGTYPHWILTIIILYSETWSSMCFLLSCITDL